MMKKIAWFISSTTALVVGIGAAAGVPKAATVTVAGVPWQNSFETAKALARSEGKLVLHLQMFGRLDDAFC